MKLLINTIIIILFCSCKKENNTNIHYEELNITLSTLNGNTYDSKTIKIGEDSIDIIIYYNGSEDIGFYINHIGTKLQFIGNSSGLLSFNLNEEINDNTYLYENGSFFYYSKVNSEIFDNIIPPNGINKYIGINVNTTGQYIGWILVNYSIDARKLFIKGFAYNEKSNESILAGQK